MSELRKKRCMTKVISGKHFPLTNRLKCKESVLFALQTMHKEKRPRSTSADGINHKPYWSFAVNAFNAAQHIKKLETTRRPQ